MTRYLNAIVLLRTRGPQSASLFFLSLFFIIGCEARSTVDVVYFKAETTLVLDQGSVEQPLLNIPRDLAFDPGSESHELVIVNRGAPYRIENGTYLPNEQAQCEWRYGHRSTPPKDARFWPSFTLIQAPGTANQTQQNMVDPWGIHFLAEASSIAFGTKHFSPRHHGPSELTTNPQHYASFGTCGESRNEMKGCVDWPNGKWKKTTPLDFQGPTLWSRDPAVLAKRNNVADDYLAGSFCNGSSDREQCVNNYTDPVCGDDNPFCDKGQKGHAFTLGSHLDMLHESPMCMGIAWQKQNVYWVFDGCGGPQFQPNKQIIRGHGENASLLADAMAGRAEEEYDRRSCKANGDIVRYDFRVDHGAGFDDHCDGLIERFAIGQVKRVDGVPSHMVMWKEHLFIADSGNKRIGRLNPKDAGQRGDYNKSALSERVNKACTVVWDREHARKNIIQPYYSQQQEGIDLDTPSGLAVMPASALPLNQTNNATDDAVLVVSDNTTSRLHFISLSAQAEAAGELLGIVDLSDVVGKGGLMGLAVHPSSNDIYLTDAMEHKVWRVTLVR
ncbi:MAG: hypothetical protein ACRBCI_15670 [Cellvibrionaceae bacterium]